MLESPEKTVRSETMDALTDAVAGLLLDLIQNGEEVVGKNAEGDAVAVRVKAGAQTINAATNFLKAFRDETPKDPAGLLKGLQKNFAKRLPFEAAPTTQ